MVVGQLKSFFWFITIGGIGGWDSACAINILGIVTSLSKSHSIFANAIFNEYATSGHSVTVLSPYDVSPNINHYKLDDLVRLRKNFRNNQNLQVDAYTAIQQSYEKGLGITRVVVKHESFKNLLSTELYIDVIIFDYDYNDALLALAYRFNRPIFILSHDTPSISLRRIINPGSPFLNLVFRRPVAEIGWRNALSNFLSNVYEKLVVDFYYHNQQERLYNEIINQMNIPRPKNPSELIVKVFTSTLATPFITTTNIINVPALHITKKRIFEYSVADPLDQFIHSTDEGCIYVSLGADTDPSTLPKDRIYAMFQVFNSRPEKIIWAWNGNTTTFTGSDKFFIKQWLPQDDVLGHRNIKAFVTNGGTLSLQEAIFHKIPIIGIPLTYAQRDNVNVVVEKGIGVKIEMANLTIQSMIWALGEVIDNNSLRYEEKLAFEATLVENQLNSPLKIVKYWISFFHQYRNENVATKVQLSAIDYYLSDTYLFMLPFLFLALLLTVICCLRLYKFASQFFVTEKYKYY